MIQQLTGTDEAAGRYCLIGLQVLIKRLLSWEDPLEKEMVIHSSVLAWEIPWTEESGRLQSMRLQSWR